MLARTDAKIDRDKLGVPGIDGFIITVEVRDGDEAGDGAERIDNDRERPFFVVARLGKFVPFPERVEASIREGDGNSYFVVPGETSHLELQGPRGTYELKKNEENRLASVSRECMTSGWKPAFREFIRELAPFLDHLSFQANLPIVIETLYCHDRENGVHVTSFKTPYAPSTMPAAEGTVIEGLFPVYALYREAKNSSSNYYKLLCYHKILEGIYKVVRPTIRKKAREQEIPIETARERVPDHPEVNEFLPEHVGKSIKAVYDDVLTPEYRNAVAHFGLNDGTLLMTSDHDWASSFAEIVLLAEVCVREVIESEEDTHRQFLDAGGVP